MIAGGGFASRDEVARFAREALSAARLDNPNIVPIYDVGEQDGQHFFTMKLVDGGSLNELVGNQEWRTQGPAWLKRSAKLMSTVGRRCITLIKENPSSRIKPAICFPENDVPLGLHPARSSVIPFWPGAPSGEPGIR